MRAGVSGEVIEEVIASAGQARGQAPGHYDNGGQGHYNNGGHYNTRGQERGRSLRRGGRRGEYNVVPCKLFFDPRILYCPYGNMCRDAHVLQAARDSSRANSGQSSNRGRVELTPVYNPRHPEMRAKASASASGNASGQGSEAASANQHQPQPQRTTSTSSASSGVSARMRVEDSLNQRASNRTHMLALEDEEWKSMMEAAEAALNKVQEERRKKSQN